ncbi:MULTISPECIES: molybdopterin synthase catalytic subunit MoaE [unclassified Oceanobacter]|jgi:molybdopterin synthase catalytic subunit|uniref:molybdopterin synthase catalytic subunit MoaE n=1 Tax=unclassified Oceanobacter TaxID=2620260 RepID=UPI0026E1AB19|nr:MULTISPECIES: molybdopterin synthase catalytic subunit MoaE [unclassified Oceanobacter]MDO6683585.1 molybdopterin synthase catalytic subunit MoaE [Oceanobacter sp. 5_MG-2023]MDP2506914.1 molybdopterin synthase catalytic subunit MoaE [Oceanobacter sp. 3_MG-2023]MDP2547759.1 molybdopterin synthase catalytic subunit MoaE [Oceanobacter sp. 4_MG-2023]
MDDIRVQRDDFSVADEYQQLCQDNRDDGAVVFFVGRVREQNQGDTISRLFLEHYPGMTERALADIVAAARKRWSLGRVRLIHRIGALDIEDQIIFIGVSSGHRQNAFDAAAYIMDFLKSQAPFWKKETLIGPTGETLSERWVDTRSSDTQARQKWDNPATPDSLP